MVDSLNLSPSCRNSGGSLIFIGSRSERRAGFCAWRRRHFRFARKAEVVTRRCTGTKVAKL